MRPVIRQWCVLWREDHLGRRSWPGDADDDADNAHNNPDHADHASHNTDDAAHDNAAHDNASHDNAAESGFGESAHRGADLAQQPARIAWRRKVTSAASCRTASFTSSP